MSFLNNIDENKVTELMQDTNSNVIYFENVTREVVESYSKDLDNIMNNIYKDIISIDQPPLNTLEKYFYLLENNIQDILMILYNLLYKYHLHFE